MLAKTFKNSPLTFEESLPNFRSNYFTKKIKTIKINIVISIFINNKK